MQWENVTSEELGKAVRSTGGVCLLPLGVLEKHGSHLPLGTDAMTVHEICVRAAQEEPAVVFPEYYFGSILEARHQPGAVALPTDLMFRLLAAVCDEIARNGFKKILIVNGHGGNDALMTTLCMDLLNRRCDYMIYLNRDGFVADDPVLESRAVYRGHADEAETSIMMYVKPDLVRNNGRPGAYGFHHGNVKKFSEAGLGTPVNWYGSFPGTLCGDETPGTFAKGEVLVRRSVEKVVSQIRLIKADDTPVRLYHRYHDQAQNPVCTDD